MAAGSIVRWLICIGVAFGSAVLATTIIDVPYQEFSYIGDGEPEWLIGGLNTPAEQACPHKYTAYTNVSFSYTFTGVGLKLYLPRAENCGNVQLTLDGNVSVVDTFYTTWDCSTAVIDRQDLPYGSHTINGTLLRASGAYMNIWKLQYTALDAQESLSLGVSATSSTAQPANTSGVGPAKSSSNIGPIIGGVAGGVALLVIVAVILYMRRRKNRRKNSLDLISPTEPPQVDPWVNPPPGQHFTHQQHHGLSPQMSDRNRISDLPTGYTATNSSSRIQLEQDHSSNAGGSSSDPSQSQHSSKGRPPQYAPQQSPGLHQSPDIQNLVQLVAGAVVNQLQHSQHQQQPWQGPAPPQPHPQYQYLPQQPHQVQPIVSTHASPPPGAAPPRVLSPAPTYYERDPMSPSRPR